MRRKKCKMKGWGGGGVCGEKGRRVEEVVYMCGGERGRGV